MDDRNLTLREFWKLTEKERCERYKDLSDRDKFAVRQGTDCAVSVPCNICAHYRGYAKCDAFPDGINVSHIQAIIDDQTISCGTEFHFKKINH